MVLLPRRLLLCVAFVGLLFVAGVTGFMTLEHETLLDAVLTTVSAISTVGYSPPRPLSEAGKVLAVVLILGGVLGIALMISVTTEYLMEGHLYGAWERRRMDRAIKELSDHFIISGFGRVGREVAATFRASNVPFVVLDINAAAQEVARAEGYLFVPEDPSHDAVLHAVGIERARGLIACSDSDTQNVYVTLTARALNPGVFIVARAAYSEAEPKLHKAGANRVVSPYVMTGRHMAELASEPMVTDSVSVLFDGRPIDVRIQEMTINEESALIGKTVRDLHESIFNGAFVLALDRGEQQIQAVRASMVIQPGDRLLIAGSREQLRRLATMR